MSQSYDLAVIGGGVIGLAHAITAARAGLRVVLIEREVRANGASVRNFGFITVTGQERGESWRLARRTRDVWADLAPRAGIAIEHRGLYLTARSPEAAVLKAKLLAEQPRHYANGVHLIIAQGADNSLIVGDSHHYDDLPGPFAPATAEEDILNEYARALGRPAPAVLERWVGTYASADDRTWLCDTPEPDVRLVIVTGGTGASTSFGIAETVLSDLFAMEFAR